jgi:type II restriction/modification system DNA methylase subunit YeeA
MGRYSLDFDGVCYAGSDSRNFKELISEGIYDTFLVDEDGILPLTDKEWFEDDVTSRVRDFLKIIYGEKYLTQNLSYISDSLSLGAIKPQAGESSLGVIRRYLSTQFYKDHLRTYKKRPIYWLFSSGKEKAFECLVYLHRYNEGTLSRLRTEYVTPLMGKLDAHHAQLSSQALDATAAQQRSIEKDLQILEKKQTELKVFDEKLKHFADQRISIDLDGGVKVNYSKFGNLLAEVKSVTGKAPSK